MPVAVCPRRSRRLIDDSFMVLVDVEEFIAVHQYMARIGQTMTLDVSGKCGDLSLIRWPLQHQAEGCDGLGGRLLRFFGDARCNVFALPDEECVVQQCQSLDRGA